ncbi:MAG TPA: cob(I)yrinic acid a,c-diamide adenosyltransferase [Bacteroidales bacterium]|nr:cob(I)yrinic acid a,c-diamide adenosyltransferase [Bacteroidales bacterium]
MKVYTRTGDDGTTSLAGGQRISKNHPRIDAYGTVDELIGWIGLLRSIPENSSRTELLLTIQGKLMHCAALLAAGKGAMIEKMKAPVEADIRLLESSIDEIEKELEPLSSFILPGGDPAGSYANIARTVCRRAERVILKLDREQNVQELIVKYINRLSDYLFVLGRKMASEKGTPEAKWIP